jgi:lantibiotic biosynthesis dehydratase-like protein
VTSGQRSGHLVPLPGTEWTVWRDAVLRTAGFPAAGLDRFAAPECAAVADAFLDGRASQQDVELAHATALAQASRAAAAIAADPLFREAITWQNPAALHALSIAGDGGQPAQPLTKRQRDKRRSREDTVARYWQRYCGKNDTIGFFGPVTWVTLDPLEPAVRVRCGRALTRSRETFYEFWALETYAACLAADPLIRPWLPAGLQPDLTVAGRQVLRPGQPPLALSPAEADLLARCDGQAPASVAAGGSPERLALLAGLAERDIVWWGVDMPYNPDAERVLRRTLTAIPDPAARQRALDGLARLDAARDAIAAAAGDPGRLAAAVSELDSEFKAVTGADPERRSGQMYAGRRLCYEETVRDLDVTFGKPVLDALAGPLGRVLLPVAGWLTASVADAYDTAFRELYHQLRQADGTRREAGGPDVGGQPAAGGIPLDQFWDAAQRLFSGSGLPAGAVTRELSRRWHELFGLAGLAPGTSSVVTSSAELAGPAAELFPTLPPRTRAARIHSPDLHICAASPEAVARGDFTIVVGELHAGWPTLDNVMFTARHPHPATLVAAAAADIGPQFRPLYPTWWPRYTARIAPVLGVTDHQLAFTHAPGADPARLLPTTSVTVHERDGALVATARDGRSWPLLEVFALLVAWAGAETFKHVSAGPHSPRVTIDRLVVARETWRTTIGGSGLTATGRLPEYLAARRLRRALGLPDQVFAKVSTEVKPVYLDLTSPRYVSAFCTMLRTARQAAGDETGIVFTEMLPRVQDAWVPGPGGQRYFSELRIQLRDPVAVPRCDPPPGTRR